jgi:hypothetical protein
VLACSLDICPRRHPSGIQGSFAQYGCAEKSRKTSYPESIRLLCLIKIRTPVATMSLTKGDLAAPSTAVSIRIRFGTEEVE